MVAASRALFTAAKKIVDEIEDTAGKMKLEGWNLVNTTTDEVLGSVYLFFEREMKDI